MKRNSKISLAFVLFDYWVNIHLMVIRLALGDSQGTRSEINFNFTLKILFQLTVMLVITLKKCLFL